MNSKTNLPILGIVLLSKRKKFASFQKKKKINLIGPCNFLKMITLPRMRRARPNLPIFRNWTYKNIPDRKKCYITPPYWTYLHSKLGTCPACPLKTRQLFRPLAQRFQNILFLRTLGFLDNTRK